MSASPPTIAALWRYLRRFLRDRFNLEEDQASEKATIEEISKGVVFRGASLWILIFAIMVASVGLNVNSTAVIIGAMLISPLMGPIMGIGLGVGINDFDLIIKAIKNLAIAVLISVLTSALYFTISPLAEAQSELLARTTPTLWDVLIALFGGLAGIVAGSRREKSNAIPGVAIATALMPPLCTAGYGLATAQWSYFFGAFYLFFINSVFISLSTFLIVRFMRYPTKEFLDAEAEKRVKRSIMLIVLITIIPSVYTAVKVVQESFFRRNANLFITEEMNFQDCEVISKHLYFKDPDNRIEVTLYGAPISDERIEKVKDRLDDYRLDNTQLIVRQGYRPDSLTGINPGMVQEMRTGIIEDLYRRNEEMLTTKDNRIKLLENELSKIQQRQVPMGDLLREARGINSSVTRLAIAPAVSVYQDSVMHRDTLYLAYVSFQRRQKTKDLQQMENWLKARVNAKTLKLVTE